MGEETTIGYEGHYKGHYKGARTMYDDGASQETSVYPGKLVRETDAAKLIDFGEDSPVWIPKSQIKSETLQSKSKLMGYELPVWLAIDKGLE